MPPSALSDVWDQPKQAKPAPAPVQKPPPAPHQPGVHFYSAPQAQGPPVHQQNAMYQQQQQQQQQQPSENLTVEQYQYDQAQRTNQLKQIVQYQAEQYGELRQHVDYNFQTMDKNLQGRIHTVHQLTENTGMELKTMITDQEEIIKEVRVAVYITAGFAGALLLLAIVLLVLWWRRNPLRSMVEEMNQVVANLKVAMSSNANLPPRARTVSLPATAGQPLSIA